MYCRPVSCLLCLSQSARKLARQKPKKKLARPRKQIGFVVALLSLFRWHHIVSLQEEDDKNNNTMFAMKRSLDDGHPPACKRARSWVSDSPSLMAAAVGPPPPPPRCDMSVQACRQCLQNPDTAEQALDALLVHDELLHAYVHQGGTPAYFYLAYALAHANQNLCLTVASKCLLVLTAVLQQQPDSVQALQTMGSIAYLMQTMRTFPSLAPQATILLQALGHDPIGRTSGCQQTTTPPVDCVPHGYARTVSW